MNESRRIFDNTCVKKFLYMPLNVLYYSNYCKHSQEVLKFIVKADLVGQLNCLCIDKRTRDHNNNQLIITLENGTKVTLPPIVNDVPSLLLINKNHTVVVGASNIIKELNVGIGPQSQSQSQSQSRFQTNENELLSYEMGSYTSNQNVSSEKFTDYNLSTEALSSTGQSTDRNLQNYVPANGRQMINTPDEDYQSEKMTSEMTIDKLQQLRNQDIGM